MSTARRAGSLLIAAAIGFIQPAFGQQRKPERPPVVHEKKDDQGRVISRVVFNPDGSIHHSAVMYGQRAAKVVVAVDLDHRREPVNEKRETFDEDGRILEREESSVRDGRRVKTRTTFAYDTESRQSSTVKVE